jgi:hypothetical protein
MLADARPRISNALIGHHVAVNGVTAVTTLTIVPAKIVSLIVGDQVTLAVVEEDLVAVPGTVKRDRIVGNADMGMVMIDETKTHTMRLRIAAERNPGIVIHAVATDSFHVYLN